MPGTLVRMSLFAEDPEALGTGPEEFHDGLFKNVAGSEDSIASAGGSAFFAKDPIPVVAPLPLT
jgi:hypothetical protein